MTVPNLLLLTVGSVALFSACASPVAPSDSDDPTTVFPERQRDARLLITYPEPGSFLASKVVRVTGTIRDIDDGEVIVNGEAAEVIDGTFETAVSVEEGLTTIEASAGGVTDIVDVLVDSIAPTVVIQHPAPGTSVEGQNVEVIGRVTDENLKTVTIGGETVEVASNGSFSHSLRVEPGAQRFRVIARDDVDHVGYGFTAFIAGEFSAPEDGIQQAASLQLGPQALGQLPSAIEPLITPARFRPMLVAANPIASGSRFSADWRVDLLGEDHGDVDIDITPSNRTLQVEARVDDIEIPFKITIDYAPDLNGTATVRRATASGSAEVSEVRGRPDVSMEDMSIELDNLLIDVSGLPGWLDRNVVTRAVRGTIESQLNALIRREIPPAIDSALSGVDNSYTFSLMGRRVVVSGEVDAITVSPTSGIRTLLNLGVSQSGVDAELVASSPGTLRFPSTHAPSGAFEDVRAGISLDILNAALYSAWSTNLLTVELQAPEIAADTPLTVGTLTLFASQLRGLAPAEASVNVFVRPSLPPVIQPSDNGVLDIHLPDLRIRMVADAGDGAEEVELVELSASIRATVYVSVVDNLITVRIGEHELMIDQVSEDNIGLPQGPALDELIDDLVEPLIADYTSLSGLRIPSVAGFQISDPRAELSRGYLAFEGRLVHRP